MVNMFILRCVVYCRSDCKGFIDIKCLLQHYYIVSQLAMILIIDARSLSLYPCNQSQNLQYVEYMNTKYINIAKICDK